MTESLKKCSPELLSLYLDRELDDEQYSRVKRHIRECQACKKELEDLSSLSRRIHVFMNDQSLPANSHIIKDPVLKKILENENNVFERIKNILSLKKIIIPATGMAVIVLLSLIFLQPNNIGPTAIVESVSGDVSSIYILETPGTRQTILWFNEKSERKTS